MTDKTFTNNERPDNDGSLIKERENIHVDDLQNIKIYFAGDLTDRNNCPLNEGTLAELVDAIRSDEGYKKKRSQLKLATLPYFTFGEFKDSRAMNENLIRIKYFVLDADGLDDVETARKKIISDPNTFVCFKSPSGEGLKTVWELDAEITDADQYEAAYTNCLADFEKRFSIKADHTIDPARACFMSHDPDIFVNIKRRPFHIDKSKAVTPKNQKEPVIHAALKGAEPGERTHNITRQIALYMHKGFSLEDTLTHVRVWNDMNRPPHDDKKIRDTVKYMFDRYKKVPVKFTMKDGSYFKNTGKNNELQISTFTIEPKELLTLPVGDCLQCDVVTNKGFKYENVVLENTDWHSKTKLLMAIGHQDCSFLGSDNDVQALCSYVNDMVEVRKKGTKIIGLVDETWVTEDSNITVSGILDPAQIIPYDKGSDAFYHKVSYQTASDPEYSQMASSFYNTVTQINDPEVIMPWLGWVFATPLKPRFQARLGGFPLVFVHGSPGSGKTSTATPLMRLLGYTDPKPNVVTMKSFPMLKLLSSTNAIPVFMDEYKVRDMKEDMVDNIHRYMRKSYNGEIESKGLANQTTRDYTLSAPMVVMGEWNITEPAIKERVIVVRFTSAVKKNPGMQSAYEALKQLHLETFMPRYIQYVLAQDVDQLICTPKNIQVVKPQFA